MYLLTHEKTKHRTSHQFLFIKLNIFLSNSLGNPTNGRALFRQFRGR